MVRAQLHAPQPRGTAPEAHRGGAGGHRLALFPPGQGVRAGRRDPGRGGREGPGEPREIQQGLPRLLRRTSRDVPFRRYRRGGAPGACHRKDPPQPRRLFHPGAAYFKGRVRRYTSRRRASALRCCREQRARPAATSWRRGGGFGCRYAELVDMPAWFPHISAFMTAPRSYIPAPAGDFVLPFDLAPLGLRGRLLRLDKASAQALSAHALPEAAGRALGEMLVLTGLLGSSLQLDRRLPRQERKNGALNLLTADYYGAEGERCAGLRGYGRVDEAGLAALGTDARNFARLAGEGVLAITIEPRLGAQSYQGIVPLSPDGIAASAETYFAQSEQLPTAIRLAAAAR